MILAARIQKAGARLEAGAQKLLVGEDVSFLVLDARSRVPVRDGEASESVVRGEKCCWEGHRASLGKARA